MVEDNFPALILHASYGSVQSGVSPVALTPAHSHTMLHAAKIIRQVVQTGGAGRLVALSNNVALHD